MERNERGSSMSALVAVVVVALLLVGGLAVDGGAKAAAARRAETAAAAAARAGSDAEAAARLVGRRDLGAARGAALESLRRAGVVGTVDVRGETVRVRTFVEVPTVFLSLLGVRTLRGTGDATSVAAPRP